LELAPAPRRALIATGTLAILFLGWVLLTRSRREHVEGHAFAVPSPEDRVLVEVLNASGRQGLAREATRLLRRRGLDVIYFGNAEGLSGLESTRVLARRGDPALARRVAQALGTGQVAEQPDSLRRVDVTVLLGKDFQGEPELHP
jgi:calcineurin-like phosphoesterase